MHRLRTLRNENCKVPLTFRRPSQLGVEIVERQLDGISVGGHGQISRDRTAIVKPPRRAGWPSTSPSCRSCCGSDGSADIDRRRAIKWLILAQANLLAKLVKQIVDKYSDVLTSNFKRVVAWPGSLIREWPFGQQLGTVLTPRGLI
jgi:hypothetical protein